MMRRSFRLGLWTGLVLGVAFAVVKAMQSRRGATETAPPPTRDPAPPAAPAKKVAKKATKAPEKKAAKKAAEPAVPVARWVEPISDDLCPSSHPVKAKLSSRIFQIPGMFAYARTRPDRCYDTEESA